MGELYIVPTPIGNLEDITIRAKNILSKVDIILCEDTRRTLQLLNHLDIKNKLISLNEHNEEKKIDSIITEIDNKSFALVSDAGTPTISDPGSKLIRSLLKNKKKVIPLPGASSLIAAYSASGLRKNDFIFNGFPPRKNQEININNLEKELYTHNLPDPDVLIRTGGTKRLSNFLLWQIAYTEIFFIDKLWPDFNEKDFNKVISKFNKIKRNYGKI